MAGYAMLDREETRWIQLAELAKRLGVDTDTRQKRGAQFEALQSRVDALRAENVQGDTQIVDELVADWRARRIEYESDLVAAWTSVRLWSFLYGAMAVGAVVVVGYLISRRVRRR